MDMDVHSSVIHNGGKLEKMSGGPSVNGRVHKTWDICVRRPHSVIQRKEGLTPATMWLTLEHLTLRARSQSPKTKIA